MVRERPKKLKRTTMPEAQKPTRPPRTCSTDLGSGSKPHGANRCMQVIQIIKSKMSSGNLMKFQQSCFGRFLGAPHHKYREDIIQHLINRMKDDRSEGILRFGFRDFEATFEQRDFFIITGMRMAPLATTPTHSCFHAREFGGEETVYFGNVETRFQEECRNSKGESDLTFKLSLLLFLYGVVFNEGGRYNRPINLRFMHVIDNIDNFNNHPWGLEGYNFFVKSMYQIFNETGRLNVSQKPNNVRVAGFVMALQLWAYESFPNLAVNLSLVEDGHINVHPRMICKWAENEAYISALTTSLRTQLQPKFVRMKPTKHERGLMHQCGMKLSMWIDNRPIESTDTTENAKRKLNFDEGESPTSMSAITSPLGHNNAFTSGRMKETLKDMSKNENDRKMIILSGLIQETLNSIRKNAATPFEKVLLDVVIQLSNVVNHTLHNTARNASNHNLTPGERTVENANEKLKARVHTRRSEPHDNTPENNHSHRRQRNNVEVRTDSDGEHGDIKADDEYMGSAPWMTETPTQSCNTQPKCASLKTMILESMPLAARVTRTPTHTQRAQALVAACIKKGTASEETIIIEEDSNMAVNAKDIGCVGRNATSIEDDIEHPSTIAVIPVETVELSQDTLAEYNTFDLYAVIEWYNDAVITKKNPLRRTPLKHTPTIDAKWFESVLIRTRWLGTDSCDVLLNLLMEHANRCPELYMDDWVMLDGLAFSRMDYTQLHTSLVTISKYVKGLHPIQRPRPWGSVTKLYGVANVMNYHWVAYMVDLTEERVVVFDSLAGDIAVRNAFTKMLRFLPWACKQMNVFSRRGLRENEKDSWELLMSTEARQQTNGHDCGIMALKFIECLARGLCLSNVDPQNCDAYRNASCANLWAITSPLEAGE